MKKSCRGRYIYIIKYRSICMQVLDMESIMSNMTQLQDWATQVGTSPAVTRIPT